MTAVQDGAAAAVAQITAAVAAAVMPLQLHLGSLAPALRCAPMPVIIIIIMLPIKP
jgi:hypothetical protein